MGEEEEGWKASEEVEGVGQSEDGSAHGEGAKVVRTHHQFIILLLLFFIGPCEYPGDKFELSFSKYYPIPSLQSPDVFREALKFSHQNPTMFSTQVAERSSTDRVGPW